MPRSGKTFVIRRADQLAALGSPVRTRIVESLAVDGPSSVRELAARIGRRPEALYYHVRTLAGVGLILLKKKRKVSRRTEAVYQLVAPRLVIDHEQRSEAYTRALADSCAGLLRLTARNYRAAIERGDFTLKGPRRSQMVRFCTARFDRDGLARLNRLLDRVVELFDKHDGVQAADTYAVTMVLTQLAAGEDP